MVVRVLKESENNNTFNKISNLCNKYGYSFDEDSSIWVIRESKYLDIRIYKSNDNKNRFVPEIYTPNRAKDKRVLDHPVLKIGTPSYGTLSIDDYAEYLEACNNAYNLVSALEKIDFSGLPEVEYDD